MKLAFIVILVLATFISRAQMNVDEFLNLVEENNSELLAAKKLTEAEKLGHQTGITPDNPTVEYGYLPANKSAMDHKTVYSVRQSLEFPTIYGVKKKMANQQGKLNDLEFELFRQSKLLKAKNRFFDYIFLLKKEKEYGTRLQHAADIRESYQKQFDNGNVSILDLNKSKIQFLNIKSDYELLQQDLLSIRKELALLIGEELPAKINPEYSLSSLLEKDSLIAELVEFHSELQYLNESLQLSDMQIKLARQSWLPNIELGYEAEQEQEGTFRGFVGGISIPLWKDKNKVKYAKAQADYQNVQLETREEIILTEFEKKYEKAVNYASILKEYQLTLEQSANINFLDKALNLGQLPVIEYFNELSFYYQTHDKFLEIELEYYKILNDLQAYKL